MLDLVVTTTVKDAYFLIIQYPSLVSLSLRSPTSEEKQTEPLKRSISRLLSVVVDRCFELRLGCRFSHACVFCQLSSSRVAVQLTLNFPPSSSPCFVFFELSNLLEALNFLFFRLVYINFLVLQFGLLLQERRILNGCQRALSLFEDRRAFSQEDLTSAIY
ncbi:hypothetical protein CHUAL_002543 [Chamberlinius hualienensis]